MESKVKEYQDLYDKYEQIHKHMLNLKNSVVEIEKKSKELKTYQNASNYNDNSTVINSMNTYIEDSINKEKTNIDYLVKNNLSNLTFSVEKVRKNLQKAVKCLSRNKASRCLKFKNTEFELFDDDSKHAENAWMLDVCIGINKFFSYIFRFDFLKMIPTAIRVICGAVVWLLLLQKMFPIYLAVFTINIAMIVMVKYSAVKYLLDNHAACMWIINPNELGQRIYNTAVQRYMKNVIALWNEEIEQINREGLTNKTCSNPLTMIVRNDLYEKFNNIQMEIDKSNSELDNINNQIQKLSNEKNVIVPKLNKIKELMYNSVPDDYYITLAIKYRNLYYDFLI
ncbi:MAG: hypothetical protein Q4D54_10550, partial [Eubacteriales bacterium]|nr:hypothetical protein [Eubacteriales bacterium]